LVPEEGITRENSGLLAVCASEVRHFVLFSSRLGVSGWVCLSLGWGSVLGGIFRVWKLHRSESEDSAEDCDARMDLVSVFGVSLIPSTKGRFLVGRL